MSNSLWPQELQPTTLPCPWNSPGKTTGVGCHCLLQWIFLTQQPNPHLLHWQADSLPLRHQGSPPSPQSNMTFENNSPPIQIWSANGKELACTQLSNKASNLSKTKNTKKHIYRNGENRSRIMSFSDFSSVNFAVKCYFVKENIKKKHLQQVHNHQKNPHLIV